MLLGNKERLCPGFGRLQHGCPARRGPVEWETPNGQIAHVNLELRFSAFHGYGGPEAEAGYLGLQCHGVLWPSPEAELPHYWPIAPPIVSGKARSQEHF